MGALLEQFAAVGVRFELSETEGLDAIGPLTAELRATIRAHRAAIVAELRPANQADVPADDRRCCVQCRNLSAEGQCRAAWRAEPLGFIAPRTYHPVPNLLQHCAGFRPFPEDPDQRPGCERWPSMNTGAAHA